MSGELKKKLLKKKKVLEKKKIDDHKSIRKIFHSSAKLIVNDSDINIKHFDQCIKVLGQK